EANNTNGGKGAGVANQGEVIWYSAIADISGLASVTATVDVINISLVGAAADDNVGVFYKLNGGAEILFPTNGNYPGNFGNNTAQVTGLSGGTLQIVIHIRNDAATDKVAFDNVIIRDASASGISIANPNTATTTVTGLPAPAAGAAPITSTLRWTASS